MTSTCGLLLPGMTLNSTIFPELPFPTISVEFNEVPPPVTGREDRMWDYVVELGRRLDTSAAWRRARRRIVIAHSFGGMLAQRWILEGSDAAKQVDRLLLVATTAGPMYEVVRLKIAELGAYEFRLGISGVMPFWNNPLVTQTVKRLFTGSLQVSTVDFRTISEPTDLKVDLAGWRNTDWRAMRSYRTAMQDFDVRARLPELTVPTMVMHGSADGLFPPPVGAALADHLPNAEYRQVDGARHILPLTHGETVRRAALELLEW